MKIDGLDITVIDSDDYAASGIVTMFFPGGEPHVKVPSFRNEVVLFLKLRTWADTGFAALVIDALERAGPASIYPFIPYFPGARQDRAEDGRAAVTLRRMANLLRARRGVSVFDPHSSVLQKLVVVRHCFMPADLMLEQLPDVVGIIAPDHGAKDRARQFRDFFYPHCALISCAKRRDSVSGALSGYIMPPLTECGRYIVVDDICDGGGTFNLLADEFKADPIGARSKLELFVSHGIFSKGLAAIDPIYERITTTDSWCRNTLSDRLTVLPLLPLTQFIPAIPGLLHA